MSARFLNWNLRVSRACTISHGYKLNFWTNHERISLMSQTYQVRVDKTLVYPRTKHSGKWKVIRGVVLEINSATVLFGWYATTGIHRRYDMFTKLKHSENKFDQNHSKWGLPHLTKNLNVETHMDTPISILTFPTNQICVLLPEGNRRFVYRNPTVWMQLQCLHPVFPATLEAGNSHRWYVEPNHDVDVGNTQP